MLILLEILLFLLTYYLYNRNKGQNILENAFVLSSGVRDENLLSSAVNTPFQTFMGNDLYPSIYDKAAQLCYGIANNHPFTDGNKRTALHSMYVYLIINGFDITATQQDVENMIIDVAADNMTNTELAQWLRENTVEIDTD